MPPVISEQHPRHRSSPQAALPALIAGFLAVSLPFVAQPWLIERDQRFREYAGALSRFYLDALLGIVSIQQNDIIKIFSIAAVIFMPPTLVASLYGMNFKHMPELEPVWGYAIPWVATLVFTVWCWVYFKRRGWM